MTGHVKVAFALALAGSCAASGLAADAGQLTNTSVRGSGFMTMWSGSPTTIVGSACEYADASSGGVDAQSASSPYVGRRAYCAADAGLYNGGAACGSCFRVSYSGSGGTDPGRAGSLVVQIVDSGSAKTFDCQLDAFRAITGSDTGIFPVSYESVDCDVAPVGSTATVLVGNNAYYAKGIFADLKQAVTAAELHIAGEVFQMSRCSGATWNVSPNGKTGAADFVLTLADGEKVHLDGCFSSWPVPSLASCNRGEDLVVQI